MQRPFIVVPAFLFAGLAAAQGSGPASPADPRPAAPAAQYRSVFEGYRSFAEQQPSDWRKANKEVGSAGGHAGHRPGQDAGRRTSKPEPDAAGGPAQRSHGGHK